MINPVDRDNILVPNDVELEVDSGDPDAPLCHSSSISCRLSDIQEQLEE